MSSRRSRRLALLAVPALAVLLAVVACGGGGHESFRGVVVEVEAPGSAAWERATLQDQFGEQRVFRPGPDLDLERWSAQALRERMEHFEPVTVFFRETRGGLVAVRIED